MITKLSSKTLMTGMGLLAFAALIFGLPADALAGGTGMDLDMQTKQLADQVSNIPKLIAVGAYVIGAFFAVRALFALKGFIEEPDDNPITKVLGFGAVSALLIMLPYIISVMTTTIGAKDSNIQSTSQNFQAGSW